MSELICGDLGKVNDEIARYIVFQNDDGAPFIDQACNFRKILICLRDGNKIFGIDFYGVTPFLRTPIISGYRINITYYSGISPYAKTQDIG